MDMNMDYVLDCKQIVIEKFAEAVRLYFCYKYQGEKDLSAYYNQAAQIYQGLLIQFGYSLEKLDDKVNKIKEKVNKEYGQ